MPLKTQSKKSYRPVAIESLAEHMINARKACKTVQIDRKKWSYTSVRKRSDEQVISSFIRLTEKHPSIGFWQCYFRMHKDGFTDNHKRMQNLLINEIKHSQKS